MTYAVFAGKGSLPKTIIKELGNAKVICFEGENDPEIKPDLLVKFGKIGQILDYLKQQQIKKVIFAGAMQRPDIKNLSPDAEGTKLLGKIMMASVFGGLGDDKLLSTISKFLEEKGFEVVAVQDVLKNLLATKGVFGSTLPNETQLSDIKLGMEILRKMGDLDIGQAIIVEDGVVLAVEAVEGTQAMIERAGLLKKSYGGVLVKMKKTGQSDKADLPAIGPDTIKQLVSAGISGVAIEADNALVLEKEKLIQISDEAGVFVTGV